MKFENLQPGSILLLKNGMYVEVLKKKVIEGIIIYKCIDITSSTSPFPVNIEYIDKDISIMDKETFLNLPLCYRTARLFAYYSNVANQEENLYIKQFWVYAVAYVIITQDENSENPTMQDVYNMMCAEIPETLRLF